MQKIAIILLFFLQFLFQGSSFGQLSKQLDSLCVLCNRSTTDSQKVVSLGKLAEYYYVFKLDDKADSVLHEQLLIAEVSNNRNLLLHALFGNAVLNISGSADRESFDKAISFIQKGIDYAKANNENDYLAIGYTRLADILNARKQYDKALANAVLALSILEKVTSDSVKAICYISLGDIYLGKEDAVSACRNYNNAFDISIKMNSIPLQSLIYHRLHEMYKKLDDKDLAKDELNKSITLNKTYGNKEGLILDYYDLARLTNEKYFIEQAIDLADSIKNFKQLLSAKRLMLVYYYVVEGNEQKALQYLENEPDLKESYANSGDDNYFQNIGNIYYYSNNPDSALYYYQLAEPEIQRKQDLKASEIILTQIAMSYDKRGNIDSAIIYYQKALKLSFQINDAAEIASIANQLSILYQKKNDFKNAFYYLQQSNHLTDSLKKLSKGNDITLLAVDRENKKHEQEILQLEKLENNKRNLQYMAITVAIVVVFFLMLFIGSFPISKLTVKLMGYFFFISLFEFIVLLIDNLFLTHATHNQPLKIWLIKIGLIGLLVPFQHFLETNMIALLASKKLIEVRTRFSVKKWWATFVKHSSKGEESLEKDTAVL